MVKKVQRGIVSIPYNETKTITIQEVDLDKTFIQLHSAGWPADDGTHALTEVTSTSISIANYYHN
jgi:hypothetical protein